jgi:hypothetical protein
MSYSLTTMRGATREEVLVALAFAFDAQVLKEQPVHEHDKEAHLASMERQLSLLPDPGEGQEYAATMNGYLSWTGSETADAKEGSFTSCGFGCSVSIVAKKTRQAEAPVEVAVLVPVIAQPEQP